MPASCRILESPEMALFKNKRGDEEPEPSAVPASPAPVFVSPAPAAIRAERGGNTTMANIGKSLRIKGDVEGDEDTVIEGRVEGRVTLKNHHLTVGANGEVQGEVSGKQVTVVGRVTGNVIASERIEVRETGQVQGDVISPRLLVTEGAQINGAITMKGSGGTAVPAPRPAAAPATVAKADVPPRPESAPRN
jgi:cytoskeletal protein CcmA (bactofilin family)